MKTEVKLITPRLAEEMLKKNTMNRSIKPIKLLDYIRQMECNLWKEETGESIKIANDGTIIDGQHRLMAIIKSGTSLNFLLITGLEKDVFTVIDSGATRTAGDVFQIAGVNNSRNISAGIRRYLLLKTGNTQFNGTSRISSSEALALYNARPKFWQSVYQMSDSWYDKSSRIISLSDFIGFYSFFWDLSNDDAFTFMDALGNGIDLSKNNPVRLLREKLMFGKANPKFNFITSVKTAMIIKTWNLFRNKTEIKILKIDIEREGFPVAV
jgi:hypothetical protein